MDNAAESSWGVIVGLVIGIPLALLVTGFVGWICVTGRDIACFELMKEKSLREYHRIVWVLRFNGPLVAFAMTVAIVFPFFEPGGWLFSLATLPISAIWLFASVRWAWWGWRTPAPLSRVFEF